ncbi:4-hydroxy-3-polyprenylbenzoate decarboxylase [Paucidesulfovibrio gracilis DSM 16080]|uniref:4-hydroxy-3-polyprenylbenzoate decarboxylase n=1 Tax=Paucidesulfovibrio gracilis DSM 16080 TaxID=1121449 RepID=A0A1T4WMN8_9BACT|nr:UbiD family decarboxylase [Paucidesulfovibrio gracilis]SKA77881.1 4-hydroxy-3-polyprenylbenzoate decarboxylase [Paucidesulfovibrio gracilis DSM 16080]
MGYRNLGECLTDLEQAGRLVRIHSEIDPFLEAGAIQRRVFQAGGPAVLFTRVKGTAFPMVCNLFGTLERTRWIFRDTLRSVEHMLALKADPMQGLRRVFRSPGQLPGLARTAWSVPPKKVSGGPVFERTTTISDLPHLVSWPNDGGAYVTLPQVYSEHPDQRGFSGSNLGMYRVQLTGNEYAPDTEVGLHYQIHRGIGAHHSKALERGEALPVNVFVGGSPAMTLAAVMPLPEGMPELFFAGAMGGRRVRMATPPGTDRGALPVLAEADFCISGEILPGAEKPEGPFGDHLGYYSLTHEFPVLRVRRVWHRRNAVWPFTTVGRPPQEDTVFGTFIHELTEPLVPTVFSGVHEVHAVDQAGVHPLLLAVGSERYVPYEKERKPQELLTNGLSLLGNTQTSLSKYVLLGAREDDPDLSAHDIPEFFRHVLERVDLSRDLHFITRTTIDTLDYSGISLNQGSKLLLTVAGTPKRKLARQLPGELRLPDFVGRPQVMAPGILVVQGPSHDQERDQHDPRMQALAEAMESQSGLEGFPLLVVVDDALFAAADWDNFLWVAFTRSDPATDLYGVGAFTHCKHWGCRGPLIMDARLKTYHAPPLETDPEVDRRVDALAAPGGPLHGIL